MNTTLKYVAAILLLLLLTPDAQAAAFPCESAKLTPTQTLTCQDADLSNADDTTATLFNSLPREMRAEWADRQGEWVHKRYACGTDRECVLGTYTAQIDQLCDLGIAVADSVAPVLLEICEREPD
jgi:uncharacterized protein